ncbi:MAG TPA: hypothetical protein VK356_07510 [Thermomicrobiales bacterium]|nr:hypothetical protein [Thermomicrobiales bacterium]
MTGRQLDTHVKIGADLLEQRRVRLMLGLDMLRFSTGPVTEADERILSMKDTRVGLSARDRYLPVY